LIREAGREPVERDTLYREVRRDAAGNVVADTTPVGAA
jgi:2-iminoacetate synthase ThiH